MRESVKFTNAALDETETKDIILRGVIDPDSLFLLKVGDYQREILTKVKIKDLMLAVKDKTVPDIDLGMRGGNYTEREGEVYLHDDVYIIDGLQRVTAAKELARGGEFIPRLGAIVHFNTDEKSEMQRFRMLNTTAAKLSPNILLRNFRHEYTVLEMLYNLTMDSSFVLYDRVSWGQAMQRHHLLTENVFVGVSARLHGQFGPGKAGNLTSRMPSMQKTMNNVGRNIMRENVKCFFDLVDECWHVRTLAFKESAPFLRQGFLVVLASVISDHRNFWDGTKLSIDRSVRIKMAHFPITDAGIAQLVAASGKSQLLLYQYWINHINSGKRTRRLVPFKGPVSPRPMAVVDEVVA